jgi:hypothetical protein
MKSFHTAPTDKHPFANESGRQAAIAIMILPPAVNFTFSIVREELSLITPAGCESANRQAGDGRAGYPGDRSNPAACPAVTAGRRRSSPYRHDIFSSSIDTTGMPSLRLSDL